VAQVIAPATQYGRYGYRRITALLRKVRNELINREVFTILTEAKILTEG